MCPLMPNAVTGQEKPAHPVPLVGGETGSEQANPGMEGLQVTAALRPPEVGGVDEGWGGGASAFPQSHCMFLPPWFSHLNLEKDGLGGGSPRLEPGHSEPLRVPSPPPFPGTTTVWDLSPGRRVW